MVKIARYAAYDEVRRVEPNMYQIPWYERKFFVVMDDGSSGDAWLEVSDPGSFMPLKLEGKTTAE